MDDDILKMGHPLLRQKAKEIHDIKAQKTQEIIHRMTEKVDALSAAGLAAPQIGESVRIIIFQVHPFTAKHKGIDVVPPMILINPKIKPLDRQMYDDWEACLSLGSLMGLVPRYKHLAYEGYNERGELVSGETSGHHARTIQHEYDHLNGVLYIDRIKDLKNLIFRDQYENWLAGTLKE